MAFKGGGRKPFVKEEPVFFLKSKVWLSIAVTGIIGMDNVFVAQRHISRWRKHLISSGPLTMTGAKNEN